MNAGRRWIDENLRSVPRPLLDTMTGAIATDPSATAAESLAAGAVALYTEVLGGAGGREDALGLLAADALLTHAFQAQAEIEPAGLGALVDRCSGDALLARSGGNDRPAR
jgi:hypothetical protein